MRIIPAFAGSTRKGPRSPGCAWDHPRIRGEHTLPINTWTAGGGSSPHSRGALDPQFEDRLPRGIIPAFAGSTHPAAWGTGARPDHPRIRGEHVLRPIVPDTLAGSSPHSRGALRVHVCARPVEGIIPAFAGSTKMYLRSASSTRDHPRIRGEHDPIAFVCPVQSGSSPHSRGALIGLVVGQVAGGIIHAFAGSTLTPTGRISFRTDHPRIRGEHETPALAEVQASGSSPHSRGARQGR